MIIDQIRAQNVLKYAELSMDLPESGLIAISGHNESGKSSIGETVCFALFGRTFSIPPDDLQKVIRWGENHCSVDLKFSVEDRQYTLSRFLDRDGNHSAKLVLSAEPEPPVARGVQGVADALFRILGFEYDEFVESFYLAQREITTPHPHSQAVKIMAGVAPLEQVVYSLNDEIAEREELLGELRAEWDAVDQDVKALGIQQGRMPQLEEARHQMGEQIGHVNSVAAGMHDALEEYSASTRDITRTQGAMGRMALLRILLLLLGLAAAGIWALLTYAPDLAQAARVRELLVQYVPRWDDTRVVWIGYLAVALGVLFVLAWMRIAGLKGRIAELRNAAMHLNDALDQARAIEIEAIAEPTADTEPTSDTAPQAQDAEQGIEADAPLRPGQTEYETLRVQLEQGSATVRMASDYVEREFSWLGYVGDTLGLQLAELDRDIDVEQSRLQEALNLGEVLDGLADKRKEIEERIADRCRGVELLQGAIAHLSGEFNREVKVLVGKMLPLFTDGRYQHLQIDEDLSVRVFSNDKRDFMDLDEVSSGTQRQIMLALRLALSKKLLSRTVKGRQFAFLDEPFAFFDQQRTRSALRALTDLGDNISQVWIVAQGFPDNCEVPFDLTISCERADDTLVVAG